MKRPLALLFATLAISCQTSSSSLPTDSGGMSASPTNAEVLAYLEDKALPVENLGKKPVVIRLEGIEALSVRSGGARSASGWMATAISFIYNTSWARYAVEAAVEHQTVGPQRVFSSFKIARISRG